MTFDLNSALAAARPGETVRVPAGDYGDVRIQARNFAEPVTVCPDEPGRALFRSLTAINCSGLVLEGLAFDWKPTEATRDSENAVSLRACQRVTVRSARVTGFPAVRGIDPATPRTADRPDSMVLGLPTGRGVYFEGCNDVALEESDVSAFHRGVVAYKTSGLTITGNDIHDLRGSGIVANGVDRVKIAENYMHSARPWSYGGNGDHADWIAIQPVTGQPVTSAGILIERNLLAQGDGAPIMGVLIGGQPGFEDVVIRDNTILGGHTQALLLGQILSGEVRGNVARRIGGEAKTTPGLLTRDNPAKFSIADNILGSAVVGAGARSIAAADGNRFDQTEAAAQELSAITAAWLAQFRASDKPEPPPVRDELKEILAARTGVRMEPLKTKGRVIIDLKKPAHAQELLGAIQAIATPR